MNLNDAVDRAADGMDEPEWAWFCYAILTSTLGVIATPVLAWTAGNQTAFHTTVGTVAGLFLVCLIQHAWYAYRNRGCTAVRDDQDRSTT